jgi:Raf kinase inhibitor-like YbhB/YbcL family protein
VFRYIIILIRTIILVGLVFYITINLEGGPYDNKMEEIKIESSAFVSGGNIPSLYSCDEQDVNPPLSFGELPRGTESMVLIVDDPDAPVGTWTHWVVYNIEPTTKISENSIPGVQGLNDFRKLEWGGPCPPSGTHRYFFKIYALDKKLDLGEGALRDSVERSMEGHILGKGELVGTFARS